MDLLTTSTGAPGTTAPVASVTVPTLAPTRRPERKSEIQRKADEARAANTAAGKMRPQRKCGGA